MPGFFLWCIKRLQKLTQNWVCPKQKKYRDRIWTQAVGLQSLWFQTLCLKGMQFSPLSFHFHCCSSWFFLFTNFERWNLCLFYTYLIQCAAELLEFFPISFAISVCHFLILEENSRVEWRVTVCPPIAFSKLF